MPPIQATYDHNELAYAAAPYRPRSRQRTRSLRGDSLRERPSSANGMNSLTADGRPTLSITPLGSFSGSQHLAQCMSAKSSAFLQNKETPNFVLTYKLLSHLLYSAMIIYRLLTILQSYRITHHDSPLLWTNRLRLSISSFATSTYIHSLVVRRARLSVLVRFIVRLWLNCSYFDRPFRYPARIARSTSITSKAPSSSSRCLCHHGAVQLSSRHKRQAGRQWQRWTTCPTWIDELCRLAQSSTCTRQRFCSASIGLGDLAGVG